MTSRKKVLLHVGLPKTGTTSVQNAIYKHRDILLQRGGILYPALAPNLTNSLCTIFLGDPLRHISNRMAGLTPEAVKAKQRAYLEELDSEISQTGWSTLLLSAEGLSNLAAQDLEKLRSWLSTFASKIEVYVCVRHPVSYTCSVIQQIMKGGATLDELEQQLPIPNYRGKLSNFIHVFGRSSIRVFDFESMVRGESGLVREFALRLGLSTQLVSLLPLSASVDNESLSMEAVMLLDSMNRNIPMFIGGVRNTNRQELTLKQLLTVRGRKFTLRPEIEKRVREECASDVAWLNDKFELGVYKDIYESPKIIGKLTNNEFCFSREAIDDIARIIATSHFL